MRPQDHLILLMEDDEVDVLLMRRALRKNNITNPLIVLPDGQEGIDYMQGIGQFGNRQTYPLPGVIILDLKMPRKSGLEFLEWMQKNPELRVIPTLLLSSSQMDCDVSRAYALGVNTYFVKPGQFDALVELVRSMQDYWQRAAKPVRSLAPPTLALSP